MWNASQEQPLRFDGLEAKLPSDMLLIVTSELNPSGLRALSCVSKRWRWLVQGEELATLWLYKHACVGSPLYNPSLCLGFTRRNQLPSVAAAERLCTWAAKEQQLCDQPRSLLLSVCRHVLVWLAEGLARMQHGLALLQWIIRAEEEAHQQQQQHTSESCSTFSERFVLSHALRAAAQAGVQDILPTLLGSWPHETLHAAGLQGYHLVEAAARGGHVSTVTYCLDCLGPDHALLGTAAVAAASAGQFEVLHMLPGRGLQVTSQPACQAMSSCARHNNVEAVALLLGCSCCAGSTAATEATAAAAAAAAVGSSTPRAATSTANAGDLTQQPAARHLAATCQAVGHPGAVQALKEACSGGFIPLVRLLLSHIQSVPEEADGILLEAAQAGDHELLKLLFAHPACGGSIARGCAGLALLEAVGGGHPRAVELLVQRPDVASSYQAAMNEAASQGATTLVTILLAHPPAVRRVSPRSRGPLGPLPDPSPSSSPPSASSPTSLQRALSGPQGGMQDVLDQALLHATLESRLDTMQALLAAGADPTWKGGMCLLSAVSRGSHGAVQVLLEWGAGTGRALGEALRSTSHSGDMHSLRLLLSHAVQHCCGGAAPTMMSAQRACSVVTQQGPPPLEASHLQAHLSMALQVAAQAGHLEVLTEVLGAWGELHAQLQQEGLLAREILHHATLLADGLATSLMEAVHAGHAHVFECLLRQLQSTTVPALEQQARRDQLDGVALAALHATASQGSAAMLKCMLAARAVDEQVLRGCAGQQAVQLAAEHAHTTCVRLLLARGADVSGCTLQCAVRQSDHGLVRVLLDAACPLAQPCPAEGAADQPPGHITTVHAGTTHSDAQVKQGSLRQGSCQSTASKPQPAGAQLGGCQGRDSSSSIPAVRPGSQPVVAAAAQPVGGTAGMASVWLWGQEVLDEAICLAVEAGSVFCTQLLLEWGTDVDAYGGQPLMAACHLGSFKLVRLLLEAGADLGVVRPEDVRSLAERGWVDVARLLRQALEGGVPAPAGDANTGPSPLRQVHDKPQQQAQQRGAHGLVQGVVHAAGQFRRPHQT